MVSTGGNPGLHLFGGLVQGFPFQPAARADNSVATSDTHDLSVTLSDQVCEAVDVSWTIGKHRLQYTDVNLVPVFVILSPICFDVLDSCLLFVSHCLVPLFVVACV